MDDVAQRNGQEAPGPGSVHAVASLHTADLDEACSAVGTRFFAHRLSPLRDSARFTMRLQSAHCGGLTVGVLRYDGADVSLDCGELADCYHFSIPIGGRVELVYDRTVATATPDQGVISGPGRHTVVTRWAAGSAQYGIKFDRRFLESELEVLLGRGIRSPIRFFPELSVRSGHGASWLGLVRTLAHELDRDGGLLFDPLMATQLSRTMSSGLLLAAEHNWSDELRRPRPPARPRTIRRAVVAVDEAPEAPHTVTGLAALTGTSVRSLQDGFARHVGMSPMAYVKKVRLERVRADLLDGGISVAESAHRWGFRHLGRFAADYRGRYHETPSQTVSQGI